MAYRGDDAGDALSAPTSEGVVKVSLGPNRLDVSLGSRTLHIAEGIATVVEHKKQKQERRASYKLTSLVVARGWPRESLGIWVELPVEKGAPVAPMQRVFGVEPADLFEGEGLAALAKLDVVATRVRAHLDGFTTVHRGAEIGSGHPLDKVLLADLGDRHVVYARKLFRDRARYAMTVHADGRVIVPDGKTMKEVEVLSRYSVTVRGDFIRFADRQGIDITRVSVPWIGPEDRDELARRIGQLVHRDERRTDAESARHQVHDERRLHRRERVRRWRERGRPR